MWEFLLLLSVSTFSDHWAHSILGNSDGQRAAARASGPEVMPPKLPAESLQLVRPGYLLVSGPLDSVVYHLLPVAKEQVFDWYVVVLLCGVPFREVAGGKVAVVGAPDDVISNVEQENVVVRASEPCEHSTALRLKT